MLCYTTQNGSAYCGDSLDLIPNILQNNSIDLLFTSPPFPLVTEKEYGNVNQEKYLEWFMQFIEVILPKIKDTGSIVLDFGNTWAKGIPAFNIYQFRVLLKLVDDYGLYLACPMYWYNPSRPPLPAVFTAKRKLRPVDKIDNVWWLCKSPLEAKADITQVLVPYSKSMKKFFRKHRNNKSMSYQKHDGALPSNLLEIPNTSNKTQYHRACRKLKIKGQPSTMPSKLAEFFIKMLTNEQDLVVDIFAGSNTTGFVADSLNRRYISIEQRLNYVAMSSFRFLNDIENAEIVYNTILNQSNLPIDMEQY
ncbi:MAG: site-specific DNA-methyltransferase [Methanobrevibacter sp.]|nr:site-specific DNA-methyltransferase [Methanobrevibacter sp.]